MIHSDQFEVRASHRSPRRVTNGESVDTQNLAIIVDLTTPPSTIVIKSSTAVDASSGTIIPAGATACFTYRLDVPSGSIAPEATYKVTSHTTITIPSGHIGTPFRPNTSASTTLLAS